MKYNHDPDLMTPEEWEEYRKQHPIPPGRKDLRNPEDRVPKPPKPETPGVRRALFVARHDCTHLGAESGRRCGTTLHPCGLHAVTTSRARPVVLGGRESDAVAGHSVTAPATPMSMVAVAKAWRASV